MRQRIVRASLTIGAIIVAACASTPEKKVAESKPAAPVYYALAVLQPTKDSKVSGRVFFSEAFGKVKVDVTVQGLDANSTHAIHIHEFGDCTAADAASAGGHYNPNQHQHGRPDDESRHAGDLGNLTTDAKGSAKQRIDMPDISISGVRNPILGRAIVIHKNPDDFVSQPAGGAGARIACGVIGATAK